jgi:hypothetical protein
MRRKATRHWVAGCAPAASLTPTRGLSASRVKLALRDVEFGRCSTGLVTTPDSTHRDSGGWRSDGAGTHQWCSDWLRPQPYTIQLMLSTASPDLGGGEATIRGAGALGKRRGRQTCLVLVADEGPVEDLRTWLTTVVARSLGPVLGYRWHQWGEREAAGQGWELALRSSYRRTTSHRSTATGAETRHRRSASGLDC